MLMTVPEIIWLILYLMDKTASTQASRTPLAMAASSPSQGDLVMEPTNTPTMAPISIIPSMAMLTTPARSHKTPENAPSVMGTARRTALLSMPPRLRDCPSADQVRKLKTKNSETIPRMTFVARPNPRETWMPPRMAETIARIYSVVWAGKTQFPITPWVNPPGVITNVVFASGEVVRINTK